MTTPCDEPKAEDCRGVFSRDWGVSYPFFRDYVQGMYDWLSCITLDRPEAPYEIPVVYSTPERAFADLTQPRVEGQVDIPKISFFMTGAQMDMERFVPTFVNPHWNKQDIGDKWRVSPRPMPYNLDFAVTVWTQFQIDQDIVAYRIMSRFTPSSYLYINGTPSRISLSSFSDTSDLEPGTDADRKIRKDYSFSVEAWMPMPYTEVGKINDFILWMTDKESGTPPEPVDGQVVIEDFEEAEPNGTLVPKVIVKEL